MTAIAARTGAGPATAHGAEIARVLGAMRARGADYAAHSESDVAGVGASWNEWEQQPDGTGQTGTVQRGAVVAVADSTLYHQPGLLRALADHGVQPAGGSPAALILAAYQAFGDACVIRLEGDFAFVLWDAERRRLFAARDFVGKRTLHYSEHGDGVAVASSIAGLLADSRVPDELNLAAIATSAAGLWGNSGDTCYSAIREVPAGHTLSWDAATGTRVERFWRPPGALLSDHRSADAAAEELRSLLVDATHQRMDPDAPTAVLLSGGWDSTAVFGAGQYRLRASAAGQQALRPVSMSYPPGDPGREDELITETTAFWNTSPEWVDIANVAMFHEPHAAARARVEPWAHPFEQWNRALARGVRRAGARVAFDGSGGDQLFQVSDIFLADLFRAGRWVQLRKQWRARGGRGARTFLRWAVRPALPDRTLRWLARLRRAGPPGHYLDRTAPVWFRGDFLREHGVFDREQRARPSLPTSSSVLAETHAYLLYPFFPRVTGHVFDFALSEGVELRSPLLDSRVVNFAVTRPWHERANGPETKILLRRAMRGLLPDTVLAPRSHRTGVTSGYFTASLRGPGRPLIEELLRDPLLATIGMINPNTLRRAWAHFLETGDDEMGARVYFTLQTELWLRERQAPGVAAVRARSAAGLTGAP